MSVVTPSRLDGDSLLAVQRGAANIQESVVHGVEAANGADVHWLDENKKLLSASIQTLSSDWDADVNENYTCWNINSDTSKHKKAAFIIARGEDDHKVYHRPVDKLSWIAYEIVHLKIFHFFHFVVSVGLLLITFLETPYIGESQLSPTHQRNIVIIHSFLEFIFLTYIAVYVILYLAWLRSKFFKHWIVAISIILLVLYADFVVAIVIKRSYFNIVRILRPFFLLDTSYMSKVRRVAMQILQVLKPILNVLILLVLFMLVFAILGYLIFATVDPDYFDSFSKSFLSLFITSTTANHPDVLMESYTLYGATPIFFVVYLILTLYFSSNVLLAVVYTSFSEADKKNFKKIFCRKRDALLQAFDMLAENQLTDPNQTKTLEFKDFVKIMHHFRPFMPEWQVLCIFKSLKKDPRREFSGCHEEDFLRLYEVLDFSWIKDDSMTSKLYWYSNFPKPVSKTFEDLQELVSHRVYKFVMGIVVLINLIVLVIYVSGIKDSSKRFAKFQEEVLPWTFIFLTIYMLDIIISILGYGPFDYFSKNLNIFDASVITVSFISAIISSQHNTWVIIVPLKLIRLVRMKHSYRHLMKTVINLTPRLLSTIVLILIIYYWFAIIGMELFYGKVKQNCCKNSPYGVGQYYADSLESNSSSPSSNVYYLNNFDHILRAYSTLFMLMIVNNWYVIMEGFASEVDPRYAWLTRLYFMMFYIVMLVVLQVIITFVVEGFQVKMESFLKTKKKISITLMKTDLEKLREEIINIDKEHTSVEWRFSNIIKKWRRGHFKMNQDMESQEDVILTGSRSHTNEDVYYLHYEQEAKEWRQERYQKKSSGDSETSNHASKTKWDLFKESARKISNNAMDFIID